jgi:ABC-type multidrug transport system fused ATPase/permease subunit
VSLLLGWHRPATGTVRIDGRLLDESVLRELRQEIAWIDPGVQLWNRSVLANVLYGSAQESGKPGFIPGVSAAIRDADLGPLLKNMPDGLQTLLGEGGMLASGGEGQRVRIARALTQRPPRLVILDEPFRGLDRAQRQKLMALVRARFADATLLCITHDVADTLDFPRVLVVEMGQIAEDSAPRALLARAGSRFRALYETEQAVKDQIWSAAAWRKVRIERGQVVES